ncbi:MAG: Oxidoreductase, partial [uncultured Pseudonocardia sp.]
GPSTARTHRRLRQPAVPGRDDVRRLRQPRPRRLDPDRPRRARRRHQLRRHRRRLRRGRVGGDRRQGARRRPARRRRPGHQGRHAARRGPQPPGRLAALDHRSGRGLPAAPPDRLDRPLPAAPPRPGNGRRRDPRRALRPRTGRQDPVLRGVEGPRLGDRRGAVDRRAPRPRAVPHRAAPVLAADPRRRVRRPADRHAPRHGRHVLQPAGRRLALGRLPQGPGDQRARLRRPAAALPGRLRRHGAGQRRQARGRRRPR